MCKSICDKRVDDKLDAAVRMAVRLDAAMHRGRVRAWLESSALGSTGSQHSLDGVTRAYSITSRGVGTAVATFEDGHSVTIFAPAPIA